MKQISAQPRRHITTGRRNPNGFVGAIQENPCGGETNPRSLPQLSYHPASDGSVLGPIRTLFRNLTIYGLGDVSTSIISLLLLPIFTKYLDPSDYGVITMLLTVEAVSKVACRWGIDTAFMRLYYDCADPAARQRLASTVFFFLLAVNGTLLLAGIASADWLAARIIGQAQQGLLVALTMANTFVAAFFFIPFQVLRIGGRSKEYIRFTTARSAATVVARLVLVIWAGQGVFGVVLADVLVTVGLALALTRQFAAQIRPVFSRDVIREALAFGLPRVPHSIAHQVIGFADRYFLNAYGTLRDVGLYSIGASFGLALKLFLSAFEAAWTPFFLDAMREPGAPRLFSRASTYIVAVLVLLVAGLCAVAPDIVRLFTTQEFHEAAKVTPWIALGVLFQGLYLVGSIGLVISKRTTFYPISTGLSAVASLVANVLLIPRYGLLGAAWANVSAYATLAVATSAFSWRLYPIPYEWSRLLRIAIAGGLSYAAARWVVPRSLSPLPSLLLHGAAAVAAYLLVLFVTGFIHAGERQFLQDLRRRVLARTPPAAAPMSSTEVEMAGDIVSAAPEIDTGPFEARPAGGAPDVSVDSRNPRR